MASFMWLTRVSKRQEFKVISGNYSKEEVK